MKPCHTKSSEHGSAAILVPHQCTEVSPLLAEVPNPSLHQHLIILLAHFIVGSPPKGSTPPSHTRPLQKLPDKGLQKSYQRLACHWLAEDAAHTLLSGVLCHSHPYSLRYRSPAQSPLQEPWEKHPQKTTSLATPLHQEDTTSHLISQCQDPWRCWEPSKDRP